MTKTPTWNDRYRGKLRRATDGCFHCPSPGCDKASQLLITIANHYRSTHEGRNPSTVHHGRA